MTTRITLKKSTRFPVSVPHNYDNGLGFGQGSVAGVYNQYYRGGFHRDSSPEFDINSRRAFNMRVYDNQCSPYRCHYDPNSLDAILKREYRYNELINDYAVPLLNKRDVDEVTCAAGTEDEGYLQSGGNSHSRSHSDTTVTHLVNDQIKNVMFVIVFVIVLFFLLSKNL